MTQLLVVFTASIFLSAALLFAVQPMFTKMVLPRLGGAPGVWSVAMVFFQAALLAGYGYAHLLTRYAPGRRSVMIHLGLMVVACFWLPLSIASRLGPPAGGRRSVLAARPVRGLDRTAVLRARRQCAAAAGLVRAHRSSVGERSLFPLCREQYRQLPCAAVLSDPDRAADPLTTQTWMWAVGFIVLILLIAGCGYLLWQSPDKAPTAAPRRGREPGTADAAPPTWGNVVRWVFLAAVPSGLLVAVTAHISTDVAAVPLLWVIPLALYLLTFVIVFSRQPIIPHWLVVEVQPVFILALVAVIVYEPIRMIVGLMAIHIVVFFVFTLMCHGELAQRRPAARYLTVVLHVDVVRRHDRRHRGRPGRALCVQLDRGISDPDRARGAVPARPRAGRRRRWQQIIVFGAVALAVLIAGPVPAVRTGHRHRPVYNAMLGGLLIVTVLFWRDPVPFAAIIAIVLLAHHHRPEGDSTMTLRSFFGVHKINETIDGQFRTLSHGTTLHGGQRIRDSRAIPSPGGRADDVLLRRLRHRAGHRRRPGGERRPDQLRRDRARHRQPDLPRAARRHVRPTTRSMR